MNELVENSGEYSRILNKYDFYIMPSMNPGKTYMQSGSQDHVKFIEYLDGYEYSRTYDRMWRKTRSTNRGSNCVGADPNRNWGYNWGGKGASTNPCHGKDPPACWI